MDFHDFKSALFIGFFMSFMIGPVFFMLIKTSILKGARAAIAFDIGVILGDITFIAIAYFGSRTLLEQIKNDPRLFLIGGFVLVIYGLITYFDKSNKKEVEEHPELQLPESNNYFKLFIKGYFLNFINIGVLAGWLAIVVVVGPALDMNSNHIFWYFVVVILGYAISDIGKILLAKQLRSKLTPYVIYKLKKGMGVLLIVFGIGLMLKGFIPKEKINSLIEKVDLK